MQNRVPVTVVTGFLGAGKTTLLRSLLENAGGRRIAVIVNEFGEMGFDGGLIEDCGDAACRPGDLVELTNGCICCTVADDFIPTMDTLLSRDLDAIVIETSGLALPQPLLKAFGWPSVRTRATVDGVITVVDALALRDGKVALDLDALAAQRAADASLDHDDPVEEVFEDQLACADVILVSKTDLVSADELRGITDRLAAVARKDVRILPGLRAASTPLVFGLEAQAEDDLAKRVGHHDLEEEHDHDDFDSFVIEATAAPSIEDLERRVARALAVPGVLRIKGHCVIDGKAAPAIVQGVGGRVDLAFARPAAQRLDQLVVIGLKGFDRGAVRDALKGPRAA